MDSEQTVENDELYGYSGLIQIKLLEHSQLAITLGVNKGAPGYNMGILIDTLTFDQNMAIYTNDEYDTTCRITFHFSKKGIRVFQQSEDYYSGCGFGFTVSANGYYKKTSSLVPVLINPGTAEQIGE